MKRTLIQNYIDQNFGLIYYPFSSLQHVKGLDSQKKTFNNIYNHLKPNGKFAFDLRKPSFEYIKENYGELQQETVNKNDTEYLVEFWSEISNEADMECDLSERVINKENNNIIYESTFKLTLLPKEQVELLLDFVGFSDYEIYGRFENEKFTKLHRRMPYKNTVLPQRTQ